MRLVQREELVRCGYMKHTLKAYSVIFFIEGPLAMIFFPESADCLNNCIRDTEWYELRGWVGEVIHVEIHSRNNDVHAGTKYVWKGYVLLNSRSSCVWNWDYPFNWLNWEYPFNWLNWEYAFNWKSKIIPLINNIKNTPLIDKRRISL